MSAYATSLAQLAAGLFLVGALAAIIVLVLRLGRALARRRDLRARYQAPAPRRAPYAVQARTAGAAQGEAPPARRGWPCRRTSTRPWPTCAPWPSRGLDRP